jgi:LysR family transcriptional regulator, glycine cleavage system transcriptional activator
MLPLVRLPSLDLVKGFVAVARRGSITLAADDLCVTQSAISKQIRTLEDNLGVQLFRRGFRSLELTEQGQMLFRVADRSVQDLQEVLALFAARPRQPVTITASTGVTGLWLLSLVGEFQALHPNIDVRLVASNSVLELGPELDLAVRYCSPRQAPLGAVKLFGEAIAPVASPALGLGELTGPDSLRDATLLEFDVGGRPWLHWAEWLAGRGWSASAARATLHYNQYDQVIQAALAGQGIALGRLQLLQPLLQDGRLVTLAAPGHPGTRSDFSYWLLQADNNPREEVRHVIEWILGNARKLEEPGSREIAEP